MQYCFCHLISLFSFLVFLCPFLLFFFPTEQVWCRGNARDSCSEVAGSTLGHDMKFFMGFPSPSRESRHSTPIRPRPLLFKCFTIRYHSIRRCIVSQLTASLHEPRKKFFFIASSFLLCLFCSCYSCFLILITIHHSCGAEWCRMKSP